MGTFLAPDHTSAVAINHQQFKVDPTNRILAVPEHLDAYVRDTLGWPATSAQAPIEVSTRAEPSKRQRVAIADPDAGKVPDIPLLGTTPVNKNKPTPGDTTGASTITDNQINQGEQGAK